MTSLRYCLAIDVGTHAVRAACVSERGDIVNTVSRDIGLRRVDASHVEQDPFEILSATQSVISECLQSLSFQPVCAGIATQRSSVLAWDAVSGEAKSQVLSWQDVRGTAAVKALRPSQDDIKARSGLMLSPHYGATKIAWLSQQCHAPNDSLIISPLVSFLLFHLLNEQPIVCDEANAGRTQLWNVLKRKWDSRLLELFNVPMQCLPNVLPISSDYGVLAGSAIPLLACCGDQNAALNALIPLKDNGVALVNIGSGGFVLSRLPDSEINNAYVKDEALRSSHLSTTRLLIGHANSERDTLHLLLEGTVNGSGTALSHLIRIFSQSESFPKLEEHFWAQLPRILTQAEPEEVFINYIGGTGSPWWQPQGHSQFVNMLTKSAIDIDELIHDNAIVAIADVCTKAVAIIESIVFMLAVNISEMAKLNHAIDSLLVTGGLSRLDGLCQRLSDITGLPVMRPSVFESTVQGAAFLALRVSSPVVSNIDKFEPQENWGLNRRFRFFCEAMPQYE